MIPLVWYIYRESPVFRRRQPWLLARDGVPHLQAEQLGGRRNQSQLGEELAEWLVSGMPPPVVLVMLAIVEIVSRE